MTTLKQYLPMIGSRRQWRTSGVLVDVEVLDVKVVFGRVDLLVQPLAGAGELWVSADSVRPNG